MPAMPGMSAMLVDAPAGACSGSGTGFLRSRSHDWTSAISSCCALMMRSASVRTAGTGKRATAKKGASGKSTLGKATDKVGGGWGVAAIAGGVAAAGAAAAALLTLRGSTPKGAPKQPGKTAHQPDGTDSSKSFQAGIADENTVPDKV